MKTTDNHSDELIDVSLQHLQAELAHIDILLQREIRRWRLAGQDPADTFRGLYVSDVEVDGLLARPLASNWGASVALSEQEAHAFTEAVIRSRQGAEAIVAQAQAQDHALRLVHLANVFGLSRFEMDVLLIALAPHLDLRYERIYSYLQDDVTRKRPTVNLVLDVLGEVGPARLRKLSYFADEAPLRRYQLIEMGSDDSGTPLLSQTLHIDETVVAWLLGDYRAKTDLSGASSLIAPHVTDESRWLLEEVDQIDLASITNAPSFPLVVFYGSDQINQQTTARHLAAHLRRPLLMVNIEAVIRRELSPLQAVRLALRDARLTSALPYLFGWDACLTADDNLPTDLLAELCDYPDLVIVAGQRRWQAEGIARERIMFFLEFPLPSYPQRLALWRHFLGLTEAVDEENEYSGEEQTAASAIDIETLAGQFILTTGQIRDTVASARDRAAQRGEALHNEDLLLAARAHSNPRLATLARKIIPRYEWDDIILAQDQMAVLHEIVATVRGRPQVLEAWGVGKKLASSAAVTVLFAGDPGTGKTMAAEVIASELALDLYKIDLSTMISKYIGETEKNLEKIFSEAESSNAILFFDEADAIFGKRSEVKDAHDRYANIEVSYLLQRMEAYDGVTILATNLRANLDEAFTRRLQFAVDFPFPEKVDRLRIWQTLFPPEVPRAADLDFELLAHRFKLAGGNIRNIIVSAAYQAAADGGQVTMHHLMHGTRRELQKMGRLIGEEDLRI